MMSLVRWLAMALMFEHAHFFNVISDTEWFRTLVRIYFIQNPETGVSFH